MPCGTHGDIDNPVSGAAQSMNQSHRNTICVENAEVLEQTAYPSEQFILRLFAPECAKRAIPGSFVHIRCDADIPMRRPLSIMRADVAEGWIEVLYKIVGTGLLALSRLKPGESVNILGPIGNGFASDPKRPLAVLIGGGVGIPPLLFLGEHLHSLFQDTGAWGASPEIPGRPVAFFGSEIPFPFVLEENARPLPGAPTDATAAIKLMEDWTIPSRLATTAGYSGCYDGYVTDLAKLWLESLDTDMLERVLIYACGPEPMLRAVTTLAREFAVPSQLCLEEFMACGVGGCAGCAVEVRTENGPAMRRVCVDGPVFPGDSVYPK
jgi:dihydroorotate dehydrogenase electron transfer subunit